ncbi:MAG: prepilin-type N-terminal cleavage/methylation domain-containing protein [Paenisporosarcina sp.]
MQKLSENEKGLTLIEVLAAIVLLSIVIVSFLSLFPQISSFNKTTEENLQAAAVAKEVKVLVKEEGTDPHPKEFSFTNERTGPSNGLYTYEGQHNEFHVVIEVDENPFNKNVNVQNLYKFKVTILNDDNRPLSVTYGFVAQSLNK